MKRPLVAFLTDYGTRDTYVSEVKAVIHSYCGDAVVVDITHEVSPFNVLEGAFLLKLAAKSFPPNTVFLGVVDPTVGGPRDAVLLETAAGKTFVGPDNGLLYPAASAEKIEAVYRIKLEKFQKVSPTFHGRDVFAHVVGRIISGQDITPYVEKKNAVTKLEIPKPVFTADCVEAYALHVDRFGNVVTNVEGSLPGEWKLCRVEVEDKVIPEVVNAVNYASVFVGQPVLLVGGTGYLELAVNQGNAALKYAVRPGDRLKIFRSR